MERVGRINSLDISIYGVIFVPTAVDTKLKGKGKRERESERESLPEEVNAIWSGYGREISFSHMQLAARRKRIPFTCFFHSPLKFLDAF